MLITNISPGIWYKEFRNINRLFHHENGRLLEICKSVSTPYSEKVLKSNKIWNVELNTVKHDVYLIILTMYVVLTLAGLAQSV